MSTTPKPKSKGGNKGHDNLIPVKKGEIRNPNGRPKGSLDRRTILRRALEKIALAQDKTPEEIESMLQEAGFKHALKGQFSFYKEISDGLYGPMDKNKGVTVNIKQEVPKEVAELTNKLNDLYRKK